MKNTLRQVVNSHLKRNKTLYFVVSLTFMAGVGIGAASAALMEVAQTEQLAEYVNRFFSIYTLQNVNNYEVFSSSFQQNIKTILFIWFGGIFVVGIPFVLWQVGIRGFRAGFTIAFLIKIYGGKGLLFSILSILPHTLILIPIFLVYSVISINFSVMLYKAKKARRDRKFFKKLYIRNIVFILCFSSAATACSLMEAYVIPVIVKPVCSIFLAS